MNDNTKYRPNRYCDILYEYNDLLLGNITTLSRYFWRMDQKHIHELILCVLKYVFEELLHWTPGDVRDRFNDDVIDFFKLRPLLERVMLPGEIDPNKDFFFYAHLLYPDVVKFDERELSLKIYKERLLGVRSKFPKEYFKGIPGEQRALECLRWIVNQKLLFKEKKDMYVFFDSSEGSNFLKEACLSQYCANNYDTKVDFLQASLYYEDEKDMFWFEYYKMNALLKKYKQMEKKVLKRKDTDFSDKLRSRERLLKGIETKYNPV